jgi:hypothetical protein
MGTMIRFERGQYDKWSQEFGPFEFVQLTYEGLRIAPDGDWLANYTEGFWRLTNEAVKTITAEELQQEWSDVIIYQATV